MLKTLVKKQLMEIFRSYFYDAKKNQKRSTLSTALFIVFFVLIMVGLLGGIFTFLSITLCDAMTSVGMDWLYFALMGLMAIFLGAFGSVFNTYSSLYIAKDNDFLLSMPIPVKIIMGSRLMSVYLMGLMYAAVIFVPAMIVYWVVAPVTVSTVVCSIIALLMISIFVMVLSCALGWLVAKISLKLKNKSIITVLVSLVLFAVYYFVCFRASYMLQAMLADLGAVGAKVMSAAYPLYVFGRAASGSWVDMLIVSAVVLALFALTWALLSRSFLKIATSTGGTAKVIYREKAAKLHSAPRALLGKELARFGSSPNYMLNCGLGLFIMPIAAVLLLIKGADISALLMDVFGSADVSAVLLAGGICVMGAMNDMAAPSVSLEGKNIWVVQSLPVPAWYVLRAKLTMHLLLAGAASLLCSVCASIVLRLDALNAVLMILLPLAYIFMMAGIGMLIDLKRPNLAWTNETAPIKQGASVTISLFGGWIYAIVIIAVYLMAADAVMSSAAYLSVALAVTVCIDALLCIWLKKRGAAIFAEL